MKSIGESCRAISCKRLKSSRFLPIIGSFTVHRFVGQKRVSARGIREQPLSERKERLKELAPGPILLADHVAGNGKALFRKACELDLEGIVAKRMTAPYREKTLWTKVRQPEGGPLGVVEGPVALRLPGG